MSFVENLRKILKQKKLTREDVANMMGVSVATVTHWANGRRTPSATKAEELANVLGVKVADLYGEEIKHPKHTVRAEVMSATAAAGTGNNIESVDVFSTGEYAVLDERLFKVKPRNLKLMRVDGHSMVPMLYPDSFVAYEPTDEYTVDGLYVINYGNELMVKLLQYNPAKNVLEIISKNPDYKSYEIHPDDQSVFRIVGKVLRCII